MKGPNKGLLLTLCCLLLVFVISGCSGGGAKSPSQNDGSGQVTLEFWTIALQPTFTDYFNQVIADYEQAHPNVRVEWKDYPYDAITNKLLTSISGGDSPDVVNLNTEFASQMGTKGAVLDMNQYLTPDEKSAYFEGIFESTVIGDKAYALPWYTGTEVLFMNKKLVEQAGLDPAAPPQTREELIEWARQIKEKTGKAGYAMQLVSKLFPIDGIPILNEDKSAAAFNNPDTEAMIRNIQQLMDEGIVIKEDADFAKQVQYYAGEQVAFELAGPTFINFIKTAAPEVYSNTIAVPLPTGKGGVRMSNSMNLVVPAKSAHPEEAVRFAVFLTNADSQTAFSKVANTLPSTKASIEDPFFTESDQSLEAEAKIVSAQSLDKATDYMVGVPNAKDINSAITRALQNILLNGADMTKTLKDLEQEVNGILQQ
ncbi:ABC transporter substrate-binding protein [Paenibacillus massiliensis]|uniref:ABC transporter substrate-binding protein n=1 Tax=Paenibacillus massiliensis TaxID=225917 RepID=UPI0004722B29|nr:sugar ABC transporter substrate-binding protein [Paenibacillus massiliensis]